jgi:hypothetical protein
VWIKKYAAVGIPNLPHKVLLRTQQLMTASIRTGFGLGVVQAISST